MTPDSQEIMAKLRALKPALKDWNIRRLRVFGSVARGEAGPESDVDLIVDFEKMPGLDFFRIEEEIEKYLSRPVDLMTEQSLKPMLRSRVLSEARDVAE